VEEINSSSKYTYTNQNNSKNKDDDKKKKKFQKIMSRACAALSDFDFSSDNSFSSEEDEKVKHKQSDFTGLCLMGKSSRIIPDSDSNSDVSDDYHSRAFL
jgi:hypothetical protein